MNKKPDPIVPATLEVISTCPKCGSPIYGEKSVTNGDFPVVQHTCDCRFKNNSFMQTK
jgi:predicted nucleic-acid-binding Zn-ribbon protein